MRFICLFALVLVAACNSSSRDSASASAQAVAQLPGNAFNDSTFGPQKNRPIDATLAAVARLTRETQATAMIAGDTRWEEMIIVYRIVSGDPETTTRPIRLDPKPVYVFSRDSATNTCSALGKCTGNWKGQTPPMQGFFLVVGYTTGAPASAMTPGRTWTQVGYALRDHAVDQLAIRFDDGERSLTAEPDWDDFEFRWKMPPLSGSTP